jgi:hypothetical protein
MIWFFERQHLRLRYEIRRHTHNNDFELVITHPDGRLEVERYADSGQILERSIKLQNRLLQDGWQPPTVRLRTSRAMPLQLSAGPYC